MAGSDSISTSRYAKSTRVRAARICTLALSQRQQSRLVKRTTSCIGRILVVLAVAARAVRAGRRGLTERAADQIGAYRLAGNVRSVDGPLEPVHHDRGDGDLRIVRGRETDEPGVVLERLLVVRERSGLARHFDVSEDRAAALAERRRRGARRDGVLHHVAEGGSGLGLEQADRGAPMLGLAVDPIDERRLHGDAAVADRGRDERRVHGRELHLAEAGGALRELESSVRNRGARLLDRLVPDGTVEEEPLGLLAERGAVEVLHGHLGEDHVRALRESHAERQAAAVDPRLVLEKLADDAAKAAVVAGLLVGGDALLEQRGAGDDLEDGGGRIERTRS